MLNSHWKAKRSASKKNVPGSLTRRSLCAIYHAELPKVARELRPPRHGEGGRCMYATTPSLCSSLPADRPAEPCRWPHRTRFGVKYCSRSTNARIADARRSVLLKRISRRCAAHCARSEGSLKLSRVRAGTAAVSYNLYMQLLLYSSYLGSGTGFILLKLLVLLASTSLLDPKIQSVHVLGAPTVN